MLFDDAVERGLQNDDRQSDQTDLGPMQGQGNHQEYAGRRLNHESGLVPASTFGRLFNVEFPKDLPNRLRQVGPIAELLDLLKHDAGGQPNRQNGHCDGSHVDEELDELPGRFEDETVIRF